MARGIALPTTIAGQHGDDGPKTSERRESVRQTTYLQLKDLILGGQLRPAERLSEQSLSRRLGVSRTPLREALMKLEKEGLVVGQRNVGYTVISFDVPAVRQLLVVREALDVCAAELACLHATDEDLARIRAIIAEMEGMRDGDGNPPSDIARSLDLGLYIHKVIAEAARNQPLIQMTDQIYQQLQLALWLEVQWVDFGNSDLVEHKAIAEAICSRDPAAAAAAARAHVRSSLANMDKVQAILESRRAHRSARSLQSALPGAGG
jgi:DNA-binding GntR family transcriptional regulator